MGRFELVMVVGQTLEFGMDGRDDFYRRACVNRRVPPHVQTQTIGIETLLAPMLARARGHAMAFNMFDDAGI